MPFTIDNKKLFQMLQMVYPIVPQKNSIQVLSNIKISLTDTTIELTATDLGHSIQVRGAIQGSGSYAMSINAKKLYDVVRELQDGDVVLDIDENVLIIESGGSFSCRIAGSGAQDYPLFPELQSIVDIQVPLATLQNMVVKTSFAVSKDEVKVCLCGILWEIEPTITRMVATDGHRLGACFYKGSYNVSDQISRIVSPKSLSHVVRIVSPDDMNTTIRVCIGEEYIFFITETFTLCSKLISGPYPDYEKVIPHNNPKVVFIDKTALQDAVRRVSVLSSQKNHLVKFLFTEDELEISVMNRDIGGEARQKIPIKYSGERHSVGFNATYFSELVGMIATKTVRMEMNTQISPCLLFSNYENEEPLTEDTLLIMPLRIMEED